MKRKVASASAGLAVRARAGAPPTPYAGMVLDVVDRIPAGKVMTYGDVAELMGRGSPRTVGAVMRDHGREVPWQRVVQASGRPAEPYLQEALRLLAAEGCPLQGERVDLAAARWDGRTPSSGGRWNGRSPSPFREGALVPLPLRPLLASAAVTVLALGAVTAGASAAPSRPGFAPAASATVKPGVQTITGGGQCTANFVFTDRKGAVYVGQSAHCAGTGAATETDGCLAESLPLGTRVTVQGASQPGVLAYSSWLAMQKAGERDANACAYNDFALVRLDPADVRRTNPSVPVFGGPVGLDSDGTSVGEQVASYGNSSLRLGLQATSPKRGISLGDAFGGWTHTVYTATPGIPGDSGSGVLDGSGKAIGTLSTVAIAPYPASNGVSDLSRQLAYARSHGVPGLVLVPGTEAFRGIL